MILCFQEAKAGFVSFLKQDTEQVKNQSKDKDNSLLVITLSPYLVTCIISAAVEGHNQSQHGMCVQLFSSLTEKKVLSTSDMVKGWTGFLVMLEDFALDMPKAPAALAYLSALTISQGILSYEDFIIALPSSLSWAVVSTLLVDVLSHLHALNADNPAIVSTIWKDGRKKLLSCISENEASSELDGDKQTKLLEDLSSMAKAKGLIL